MGNQKEYMFLGNQHSRDNPETGEREKFYYGDTFTPTDDELDAFGDLLQPVENVSEGDGDTDVDGAVVEQLDDMEQSALVSVYRSRVGPIEEGFDEDELRQDGTPKVGPLRDKLRDELS